MIGWILLVSALCADAAPVPNRWPSVKPGVWQIYGKRTLPRSKQTSWTEKEGHCNAEDVELLFEGYWGDGKIEMAGCRWQSAQLGPDTFKVSGECRIRGVKSSKTESTVTIKDDGHFEIRVRLTEDRRSYAVTEVGRWLSACGNTP